MKASTLEKQWSVNLNKVSIHISELCLFYLMEFHQGNKRKKKIVSWTYENSAFNILFFKIGHRSLPSLFELAVREWRHLKILLPIANNL